MQSPQHLVNSKLKTGLIAFITGAIFGAVAADAPTATKTAPPNQRASDEVLCARARVSDGDPARLWRVFARARRGETVVVAVIGGSITAGASASKPEFRYGNRVAAWWREQFPKATIKFINAGIGATGSDYGALRVQRDLLKEHPDFVIVEYAVNDPQEPRCAETLEGVVRQILNSPRQPAVMLLFTMHQNGSNAQEWHGKVGRYYGLSMVSFRDALWPEIQAGRLNWSDVEADIVHPNDRGHGYAAQFITHLLETTLASFPENVALPPTKPLPLPRFTDLFENTTLVEADALRPLTNNGWMFDARNRCWKSDLPGSAIEFEIEGRAVLTMHRVIRGPMGRARVTVDGGAPKELEGWFNQTWGGYRKTQEIARDLAAAKHRVRFELLADKSVESTGHEFWIYGLGAGETRIHTGGMITLDGQGPGRVFEGIGGLSAGAGSRLLFDYPEPQRGQLLDFLFKPNFGASLHHLKVEIGGDVNSTEGSEPSYARTRKEFEHPRREYFNRGYEWWLMREAKKRNPKIFLDVLQWGAPDWIGDRDFPDSGDPNTLPWDKRMQRNRRKFFTQDNADFIAGFILGAKKYHGLNLDYCGTWNESPGGDVWEGPRLDVPWMKSLRATLDARGLSRVKIIARDSDGGIDPRTWRIVELMEQDAKLKEAIYAAGAHYPSRQSTAAARQCGKPLWASEDCAGWSGAALYSENREGYGGKLGWKEALALAKTYNLNYVNGRMTKTVVCYLINSYYDSLSFAKCSAIRAVEPWSGHYEIWLPTWAMAHTAQFAQPGWKYLDGACGALKDGGSYVCLRSPKRGGDFSVIIETGDAEQPQTLTFRVTGGLSAKTVHVWRSGEQSQFERQKDIRRTGDSFTVTVEPRYIYSLTTTTGQRKAKANIPPPSDFPTPYRDNFDGYGIGKMARYFADQSGTFEVARRPGGGSCLQQPLTRRGIDWEHYPTPEPYTIIGSANWCDYEVSCDARIEGEGYAAIFGRIKCSLLSQSDPPQGYWLKVNEDGRWELKAFKETLAAGAVAFDADQWHQLALKFSGSRITASIDSAELKTIDHDMDFIGYDQGMAGLGTGWNKAQFDNFSVRKISGAGSLPRRINLARSGKATASSDYSAAYDARRANDGNPVTRWNAAVGDEVGAWLEIDFGQPTRFDCVALKQLDGRIAKYKIQYLQGDQWRDAFSGETSTDFWRASFVPVQSSKVRLLVISVRNNLTASIFEFGVYDGER